MDLCKSCRKKTGKKRKSNENPIKIKCNNCGVKFQRFYSNLGGKNCYCSKLCESLSSLKKYEHLKKTFKENKDEVAYLFGMILGDGHVKRCQKYTAKINIAFDTHHPKILELFKKVMAKLKINFHVEPMIHENCQKINFTLPNQLLKRYNMLWDGDKFQAQPMPKSVITNNINFASGLIDSDGNLRTTPEGFESIRFCNTCKSIVESMSKTLNKNNIFFGLYYYVLKPDKRSGKMPKPVYNIVISRKSEIFKIRKMTNIGIKYKI
jgi:hypothetical protein